MSYFILAGTPASGGLTCYGASYVEHQLDMHGVPIALADDLRKRLSTYSVMPFKLRLSACIHWGSYWLVFPNAASVATLFSHAL